MFQNNSIHEKQIILLMISNGKGREVKSEGQWHYLTVEKLLNLMVIFIILIAFIVLQQKKYSNP